MALGQVSKNLGKFPGKWKEETETNQMDGRAEQLTAS